MHRTLTRTCSTAVVIALAVGAVAACGSGDSSGADSASSAPSTTASSASSATEYDPQIDPADFTDAPTNEYLPLTPGNRWVYEGESDEGVERVEVVVTEQTKEIMGIETTVVRDTVTIDDVIVEDTLDWFATDNDGNVWYFGEDVRNFVDGQASDTDGSFEAGVDGALPGIAMEADPQPGDHYRQEYYEGEAEDEATILRVGEDDVTVPAGSFDQLLVTEDINPLDPDNIVENKFYAPGVGLVAEEKVTGPAERVELIDYQVR